MLVRGFEASKKTSSKARTALVSIRQIFVLSFRRAQIVKIEKSFYDDGVDLIQT